MRLVLAALSLMTLCASACGPATREQREPMFLISIVDLPLGRDEPVHAFRLDTWGVVFEAVCAIPPGWTINAGGSLNPTGVLEGRGGQGISWLSDQSPRELDRFVLARVTGGILAQRRVVEHGEVPATFVGWATVSTDDGDRQAPLTISNIRLTRADRCPDVVRPRS